MVFIILKHSGPSSGLYIPWFHNYLDKQYPCLSQAHIINQWQIIKKQNKKVEY